MRLAAEFGRGGGDAGRGPAHHAPETALAPGGPDRFQHGHRSAFIHLPGSAHPSFDFYTCVSNVRLSQSELGISHLYLSPCLAAAARQPAWVRCRGPFPGQSGTGRAGGLRCPLSRAPRIGLGAGAGCRPQPHGHRRAREPVVVGCAGQRPASRYAGHFDIRWDSPDTDLRNKVLVPILGDEFECCLQAREIQLRRRGEDIHVGYFDHELPVSAASLMELQRAAGAAAGSPSSTRCDRNRPTGAAAAAGVGRPVDRMTPPKRPRMQPSRGSTPSRSCLKRFLDLQHYRLAFWRHAHRELNYRRFFDIHHLAGIRVEEEEVFAAVHERVLRWVQEGRVGRFAHRSPGRSAGPHRLPAAVAQRSAGDLDCG